MHLDDAGELRHDRTCVRDEYNMFIPVPIFEGQQLQSLLDGRFT
jgi:hypothetical protein